MGGDAVLWVIVTAAGTGFLLGLQFRWPAILAASAVVAALCVGTMPFTELPWLTSVISTFASLSALQGGYLAGAWSRVRFFSPLAAPHIFADNEPSRGRGTRGR
jgi:hypothetical protein